MRIVHVLHSHGYGGAENHALVLMKGQRAAGHEVLFAGPTDSWLGRACVDNGIPTLHLRMSGLFDLPSHFTLRRLLRRWHADVVHGHLVRGAQYAGLAGHRHQRPVAICTAHATTAAKHMERCAHIIAVSGAVQQNLLKHGYSRDGVSVIYNGMPDGPKVDRAAIRAELNIPADQLAIVNVGRFIHDKGQDLLVQAMTTLPCPEAHLYLIGDPDTDFGRAIQAQTKAGGSGSTRIHFLGYRSDVQRILPAFDLYALSSRREALGLSVIEAFSAQLPVVATRVGGVPEIVLHDDTGWLVDPESPEALTAGLAQLCHDPALRVKLGERGRRFYEARLTDRSMVEQTLLIYQRYLDRARHA
ncbi:MAG TPA: glycosyltransferase [Aquabacterium sp.]|nr:glycosyltransferase [Aquabacterium sp.]